MFLPFFALELPIWYSLSAVAVSLLSTDGYCRVLLSVVAKEVTYRLGNPRKWDKIEVAT